MLAPLAWRLANVERVNRLVDYRGGLFVNDQRKLQSFIHYINNDAGTLKHLFSATVLSPIFWGPRFNPVYADKIIDRKVNGDWTNLPTLSGSVNFAGGAGRLSGSNQIVILNTDFIRGDITFPGWAEVMYYDGNVLRPRVRMSMASNDVNGVIRPRVTLYFMSGITTANFDINTTNIPSGKSLATRVTVFV